MAKHQCEEWQMLESAKGDWYCGACGEHEIPADAGATVYECPHHDYCDGGCGHVYNADEGR